MGAELAEFNRSDWTTVPLGPLRATALVRAFTASWEVIRSAME
jgi:hypothetical protein